MGDECLVVVPVGDLEERRVVIVTAVDLGTLASFKDRGDIVAGDRLVGLQSMGNGQHHQPVLVQQHGRFIEDVGETHLDPVGHVCRCRASESSLSAGVGYPPPPPINSWITACAAMVSPIPYALSMTVANMWPYEDLRYPADLSPSKNIRSPASEASDTMMSISYIERQLTKVSSLLLLMTTP